MTNLGMKTAHDLGKIHLVYPKLSNCIYRGTSIEVYRCYGATWEVRLTGGELKIERFGW